MYILYVGDTPSVSYRSQGGPAGEASHLFQVSHILKRNGETIPLDKIAARAFESYSQPSSTSRWCHGQLAASARW
jgi:hypothetical protein